MVDQSFPEAPPRSSDTVRAFGRTLVVAPHPDDETLGCGGTIALLRQARVPVQVLVVTDGTLSHPRSRRYPRDALRTLREAESLAALAILGVARDAVRFLRLPDGGVPAAGTVVFETALGHWSTYLAALAVQTILLPWRRDPHPDHRACSRLVRAAVALRPCRPRLLEYPLWLWERGAVGDRPTVADGEAWRLDIRHVLPRKRTAIAAYRSQLTNLIDDDPTGFRLGPVLLAGCTRPWELFVENRG